MRQLLAYLAGARGHFVFAGTPEQVADLIEDWFSDGAADGFNIMPPILPAMLDVFSAEVIPILQKRGLFRTAYAGKTLREHYGLDWPETVFKAGVTLHAPRLRSHDGRRVALVNLVTSVRACARSDMALVRDLVRGEHIRDRSQAHSLPAVPGAPASNCSGSANNLIFGFRKPLNSPALRMTPRATQPPSSIATRMRVPSPSTGSMPELAHHVPKRLACNPSRLPNRLSLSLQNPTFGMSAARSMSASAQIGSSSMIGTVDTLATLALASQSSASQGCSNSSMPDGSSAAAKRQPSRFRIGAVGVEPHGGAPGDGALDRVDAREVGVGILADLDLEGAKASVEMLLDLLLDVLAASELLNGVSSGSRISRSTFSSG